ncbi:MAG TPA: hypothetical protein VHB01_03450 [Nitrosospira sp.]|nr:hypothetical protein [Nitrosospira sp.]
MQQIIIALENPSSAERAFHTVLVGSLEPLAGQSIAGVENPLVGVTPIMDWAREHYGKDYMPNTRETFRRQIMHQFCDAGIVPYNPNKPEDRLSNWPAALALLRIWQHREQMGLLRYPSASWLRCRCRFTRQDARRSSAFHTEELAVAGGICHQPWGGE